MTLALLCHSRVKSSRDTVAKSLESDYRPEHVFALKQSLAAFRYYQGLVGEVDQELWKTGSGIGKRGNSNSLAETDQGVTVPAMPL